MRGLLGGYSLTGNYRIQSGAVASPFVFGTDLNGDLSATNDRPSVGNPSAPANSVAFASSVAPTACGSAFCDVNGNPIDPNNARFIVDPNNRTNIAGRNTLRAPKVNSLDLSMQKRIKFFEAHALEIRVEFFNVFNHPQFTWGSPADADVTNPFFNQLTLNDGGIAYPTNGQTFGRYGRIQLRYSF